SDQIIASDLALDQNAVAKDFDSTDSAFVAKEIISSSSLGFGTLCIMLRRSRRIQNRVDRLSDLPDCILHHILSFLDTKSSIRTCILSRRWRCVWKYVDVLNFSRSSFEDDLHFQQHVDQVLSFRSDHMDVAGLVCTSYQSLKVLELSQASIDKTSFGLWSCLQLLESLTLTDCCFNFGDASADAFANFPILESLKLVHCYDPGIQSSFLKVTGPKLINLEIVSPGFNSFEIDAPKLQTFGLKSHYPYGTLPDVSKSNLPSLNRANIELLGNKHSLCTFSLVAAVISLSNVCSSRIRTC
ncbi:Putative F-box/LRR-repeat protein At5g02930, partial [Linum perenne]